MSYLNALRALGLVQGGMEVRREMQSLQEITRVPQWPEYIHCLKITPRYQRVDQLSKIMHQSLAIWIAALVEHGVTARDIQLAVRNWAEHHTDSFSVTCIVAAMPDDAFKQELCKMIAKKYPNARVCYQIDPGISAGLKLVFPKFAIDYSLRRKCSALMKECYAATC